MKLALLSDIHANIQAFEACLAHADDHGANQIALLGDLVGYGADPVAVVQRAQQLIVQGAWALKGNHDEMAVSPPSDIKTVGDSTAAWTHAQLNAEQRQFLDGLPMTLHHHNMLLVHASVDGPELWRYVYDERAAGASLDAAANLSDGLADVRYVFGGHVHLQTLYYRGSGGGTGGQGLMKFTPTPGVAVPVPKHRHWLATIGSVGQPRDGHTQAMYALFDTDKMQLTFHRVPYDFEAAAAAIRQTTLPAFFADRLEQGR